MIRKSHYTEINLTTSTKIDCIDKLGRAAVGIAWSDTAGHAHEITLRLNAIRRKEKGAYTQHGAYASAPDEIVVSWKPSSADDLLVTLSSTDPQMGKGTGMFDGLEVTSIEVTSVPHTGTLLYIW